MRIYCTTRLTGGQVVVGGSAYHFLMWMTVAKTLRAYPTFLNVLSEEAKTCDTAYINHDIQAALEPLRCLR
jgi:hypothetical protein